VEKHKERRIKKKRKNKSKEGKTRAGKGEIWISLGKLTTYCM
jgi:hypothetical protein